jgi:hypothetical protein
MRSHGSNCNFPDVRRVEPEGWTASTQTAATTAGFDESGICDWPSVDLLASTADPPAASGEDVTPSLEGSERGKFEFRVAIGDAAPAVCEVHASAEDPHSPGMVLPGTGSGPQDAQEYTLPVSADNGGEAVVVNSGHSVDQLVQQPTVVVPTDYVATARSVVVANPSDGFGWLFSAKLYGWNLPEFVLGAVAACLAGGLLAWTIDSLRPSNQRGEHSATRDAWPTPQTTSPVPQSVGRILRPKRIQEQPQGV